MEAQASDALAGGSWTPAQAVCPIIGRGAFAQFPAPGSTARREACGDFDRIEGILFEPGNVLYDDTLWRRWLLKVLTRMGLHTHYQVFFSVWQLEYVPQVHRGEKEFVAVLREFLAAMGFVSGQIEELLAATKAQRLRFDAEHRLLPGVAQVLTTLQQRGIKLAVAADSAFPSGHHVEKFNRLGLAGRFAGVISSRDLGVCKPQPECYQAALDLIGLPADRVALISCHAHHLDGASAYGLLPIASHCPQTSDGMAAIERFEELLQLFPAKGANRLAG